MKKIICIFLSLALFVSFNTAGVVLADGESGMVQTITPLDDACYDPYPKWAPTSPYLYAQRRFGEERRNISKDLAPEEFRRRLEQAFDSCFATFVSDPRFAGSQSKGDLMKNIGQFSYVDSVLCECCCDSTRYLDESKFNKRVERYLAPLPKLENPTDSLMLRVTEMVKVKK